MLLIVAVAAKLGLSAVMVTAAVEAVTSVPVALPNPTALDTVLARLVLAQARRDDPVNAAEVAALRAALQHRPRPETPPTDAEPLTRQPVPSLPS